MAENNPKIPKDILHQLNRKQAHGLTELGKWREAAEMFLDAGDFEKAIEVNGQHKHVDGLVDVVRRLDKEQVDLLKKCAVLFIQLGKPKHAKEVYVKIGDSKALVLLYVKMRKWDDAFGILKQNPGLYEKDVYLPYAEYLALNDKFDEAQKAYREAGLPELSLKMLGQLTRNAVTEHRFKDAAFYYWLLAQENIKLIPETITRKRKFNKKQVAAYKSYRLYNKRARQYYAYNFIYQSLEQPFTKLKAVQLFNIGRYLLNTLHDPKNDGRQTEAPFGISRAYILFALAKHSKALGAYKLARETNAQLQQLMINPMWVDVIDLDLMTLQSKPMSDKEELLQVCYRCGFRNPLITAQGKSMDACMNCHHPFVRSFSQFDHLPLVEFVTPKDMNDEEAINHIQAIVGPKGEVEAKTEEVDRWTDKGDSNGNGEVTPFSEALARFNERNDRKNYKPLELDKRVIRSLKEEEVFIVHPACSADNCKFYKNMSPDVSIKLSRAGIFFHRTDYEEIYLTEGHCPLSRKKDPEMEGVTEEEITKNH
jgi:intraflagellar transport protein 122